MKKNVRIEQSNDVEIQNFDDDKNERRNFDDNEFVKIDWFQKDNNFDENRMCNYRFVHRFSEVLVKFRFTFVISFVFVLSRLVLTLILILILILIIVVLLILVSASFLLFVLSDLFDNDKMKMLDDALDDVVIKLLIMIASFDFLNDNFDMFENDVLLKRFNEILDKIDNQKNKINIVYCII